MPRATWPRTSVAGRAGRPLHDQLSYAIGVGAAADDLCRPARDGRRGRGRDRARDPGGHGPHPARHPRASWLNRPIYARTAAYGHFGRAPEADGGFSWERADLAEALRRSVARAPDRLEADRLETAGPGRLSARAHDRQRTTIPPRASGATCTAARAARRSGRLPAGAAGGRAPTASCRRRAGGEPARACWTCRAAAAPVARDRVRGRGAPRPHGAPTRRDDPGAEPFVNGSRRPGQARAVGVGTPLHPGTRGTSGGAAEGSLERPSCCIRPLPKARPPPALRTEPLGCCSPRHGARGGAAGRHDIEDYVRQTLEEVPAAGFALERGPVGEPWATGRAPATRPRRAGGAGARIT
jgi:hypothetical protein